MSYPDAIVGAFLPSFPRTPHLPWKPNATRDDLVASELEARIVFEPRSQWTEKIDGASVGMGFLDDGIFRARNRDHILDKAYLKETAAKKQFRSIWNWGYSNREKFGNLNRLFGYPVAVYGEWCYAVHTIRYNRLPSLLIAYDIYDPDIRGWVSPVRARLMLASAGFTLPEEIANPHSYSQAEALCSVPSTFGDERREGLYVKIGDDTRVTHRFKMVRPDFVRSQNFSRKTLELQKLNA